MFIKIVDNCPKCGSGMTGYFLRGQVNNELRIKKFKRGERIRFLDEYENPFLNCFCVKCRHRWHSVLKLKWIKRSEFQEYLEEKGFFEQRESFKTHGFSEEDKKMMALYEKEQRWKIGSYIVGGLTGINLKKYNPYTKKISRQLNEEAGAYDEGISEYDFTDDEDEYWE